MSVYVEKGAHINATVYVGAKVEIWGMVTQYNSKWEIEIRANSQDNVKLVTPSVTYTVVNIIELLENTSAYNGTLVEIPNATVINVYSSWLFWVSNSTQDIKDIAVYAQKGVNVPTLGKGDIVKIYGNVTYHNGSYEILLRAGTPDKVVVIHSSARYINLSYLHQVDANGTLIHLGEQVIVNATVISAPDVFSFISSSGKSLLKMYIEDSAGGVLVFGYNLDYTKLNLTEGDKIQVRGTIAQYNGEAELKISSLEYIKYLGRGSVPSPMLLSTGYFSNWTAAEKIEGMLIKINGTVTSVNVNSGYFYLDDGSGAIEIYAKAAGIDISNITKGENLTVVGIVSQYDRTLPYTSYYEIMPRYSSDISENSTSSSFKNYEVNLPENYHNWIGIEEVCLWRIDTALIVEDMWDH
jgi:DNA/RNA endonuclease YhcR with UshA esterase domain